MGSPEVLPLASVVDALDRYLDLYAEAAELHHLLPPDVRALVDQQPDPNVEVRTLLAHLALLSDETRRSITETLGVARRTVVMADQRIAELEREVAVLRSRLQQTLVALGVAADGP